MALKRKRSFGISPSSSSDERSGVPKFSYAADSSIIASVFPEGAMDMEVDPLRMETGPGTPCSGIGRESWISSTRDMHLDSRTKKRFRNARPSDELVHEHTLALLFSNSPGHPPRSSSVPSAPVSRQRASSSSASVGKKPQHQSSLHNFWSLPASRASPASSAPSLLNSFTSPLLSKCEDCDVLLPSQDIDGYGVVGNMDIDMMMMDMGGPVGASPGKGNAFGCLSCGRQVCGQCSIDGIEGRKCLQCSTASSAGKQWVGGIGWV